MSHVNEFRFCIKVRNNYFQDYIHKNSLGILERDVVGTEFTSEELADVIIEVTKFNNKYNPSAEIIVQLCKYED